MAKQIVVVNCYTCPYFQENEYNIYGSRCSKTGRLVRFTEINKHCPLPDAKEEK